MANTKIIDYQMFRDRLKDAFTDKLESNVGIKIVDKTFGTLDQRTDQLAKKVEMEDRRGKAVQYAIDKLKIEGKTLTYEETDQDLYTDLANKLIERIKEKGDEDWKSFVDNLQQGGRRRRRKRTAKKHHKKHHKKSHKKKRKSRSRRRRY